MKRIAWHSIVAVALVSLSTSRGTAQIVTPSCSNTGTPHCYYFSDCPGPGGSGTVADPYCLKPPGQSTNISFAFLAGGGGPSLGPGDVVYLCAGPCNGSGSGIYHVAGVGGSDTFFHAETSGQSGSPITIQPFPGETVTITGDAKDDRVFNTGDIHIMIDANGKANYQILGDPQRTGQPHLSFIYAGGRGFHASTAGAANWVLDGIEMGWIGKCLWSITGTQGFWEAGCTDADSVVDTAFRIQNAAGSFVLRNSKIHHIADFGTRITINPDPNVSVLVENNEFYNLQNATNDYATNNITYRGNRIHDCYGGIDVEKDTRNIIIEDNVVWCEGVYNLRNNKCHFGIRVESESSPTNGNRYITVRRNRIYGLKTPASGTGYMANGIKFAPLNPNSEPLDAVVENNLIWNIQNTCSGHSYECAGIDIMSDKPVTVQNNSIYFSRYPIQLNGVNSNVSHVLKDNLVVRGETYNGVNTEEVFLFSRAAGSRVENNNLWNYGAGGTVLQTQGGAGYGCSNVGGIGIGNKCGPTTFVSVAGVDYSKWDLHLSPTDTSNRGQGSSGALDDIDKQARGSQVDIGADQVVGGGPVASISLNPLPPQLNGVGLLKVGVWTVNLSTSPAVVSLPSPVIFTDSRGSQILVVMTGSLPGSAFSGTLTVGSAVADGTGTFGLAVDALVDSQGNKGNTITGGSTVIIDQTAPAKPTTPIVM